MGKHELKNKKDEGKWNWALLAANVLLMLCFAAVFWPILHKGSLSFLDKTSNLLALAAFLPLVLRPWKKAPAPLALLHDLLLLGSASAVSVVVVEYMVKGGSVGLEQSFWQGWLCYIGLYAAAYLITARGRHAVCVGMGISLLHGLIDHYVMLFRGTPVMLSDVFSIGTAANVAQGYSAPVELSVLRGVSTAVLYCVLVCLMQRRWKLFDRWYVRRGCSLIVVALAAYAVHYGLGITGTSINFWASSRSYSEFYYFLRCAGRSIVRAPEGYSADGLQTLAEDYKGEQGTKTPNIIVIMNESFSDLGIVGNFETNEDYMPFVHSMQKGQKNTITGNLLVSTFGGGTANTEFEFLSGDTMAFLPFGCSPYQMYVKSEMPSLVGALEAQNYQTVAMHPYLSTSWNRPQVYQSFGFDEQCYEDSFPSDVERVRGRVSDSASYKKIIELYENREEGQPFFLFDVTMQNHGGYEREGYPAFEEKIRLTGEYEGRYQQVDTYLSLVRCSDEAVQELISYFANVSEDTAIIFFGDHQPNVPSAFYDELYGNTDAERSREQKQTKLITPFFIWANYDIGSQTGVEVSANYLSAFALDALGCSTSGFDELRLAAQQSVPRINSYGYYLADGSWHDNETLSECEALTAYRSAQYAQIFDPKKRIPQWYLP